MQFIFIAIHNTFEFVDLNSSIPTTNQIWAHIHINIFSHIDRY